MISVQDFASRVKKKYPQYNHVDDNTLTQKMLAKYPEYQGRVQQAPEDKVSGLAKGLLDTSQGMSDAFRSAGLGGVSDILASLPMSQNVQKATGINPAMKSSEMKDRMMQTPVGQMPNPLTAGADAVGAASWMLPVGKGILPAAATGAARGEMYGLSQKKDPIASLPYAAGGAVLEPLAQLVGKVAPLLSKKGASAASEEAVQKAPKTSDINWDQLEADVRKNVENRLGNTPEIKTALDQALAEKTPQFGLGEADQTAMNLPKDMSPEELLQWRRQISARGASSGILQNLFKGTNVEDKVNSVLRDTISQTLHGAVPQTMTPDKLYSLYSKMGGDVPQWVTRLLAGWAADKTIGKQFGSAYEPLIDLGAGALAGRLPIP